MATWTPPTWPDGKRFAFTIFDDPDGQTLEGGKLVYSILADLGFRTTRGVWPLGPTREINSRGETCANPAYVAHNLELQKLGFEMGFHNAAPHSVSREESRHGLDLFRDYFGHYPHAMANHYNEDAMYWGPARLTGFMRTLYGVCTLGRTAGNFRGHVENHPAFWGDICQDRVRYCRNFVYADINTLKACPFMPYYDPDRPFVRNWYASSEGANAPSFLKMLTPENQDRLEEEGGLCIMYTHFGHGFVDDNNNLIPNFRELMTRISKKNGWFVPVTTILDYLIEKKGAVTIQANQRRSLEAKWLWGKLFQGTS